MLLIAVVSLVRRTRGEAIMLDLVRWVLVLALVATFGCAGQNSSGDVRTELAEFNRQIEKLKESQRELHSKVDKLARRVATPYARAQRPDPDKRHTVAVGDAPAKGPRSASVKIVAWMDFQ